jgi:hypothetical protein
MNMKRLAMGVAMALVIALAIGRAGAKGCKDGCPFEGTLSRSAFSTEIDTNRDGVTAVFGAGPFLTNMGAFNLQVLTEGLPPISPTGACPSDSIEIPVLLVQAVSIDVKTGDQLLLQATSGTVCLNPATGMLSASATGIFADGTGEFAGATGSFTFRSTGRVLVSDPFGRVFFSETGALTGTLIFP